jgi:hypothetical protein
VKHVAYVDGELVALVEKNRHGKWTLYWPRRAWSKEPIPNPKMAKVWVKTVLNGKQVTWQRVSEVRDVKGN